MQEEFSGHQFFEEMQVPYILAKVQTHKIIVGNLISDYVFVSLENCISLSAAACKHLQC